MSKNELQIVKAKIKEIIVLLVNRDENISLTVDDIKDDTELSNNPAIPMNSITAMRLLVEIEKEFNIEVPDESLTMENFINVSTIANFILDLKLIRF